VRKLYQMLFEMASGNFSFRIPEDGSGDELARLTAALNSLSGALRGAILSHGSTIPFYTYQNLVQFTMVLDASLTIRAVSADMQTHIRNDVYSFISLPFSRLLAEDSALFWQGMAPEITRDPNYHNTVQLNFATGNGAVVPSFCTVCRLLPPGDVFVSAVTTILQELMADKFGLPAPQPRRSEARLIQDVHDYILAHLDQPLPSAKELSAIFGTNEFRIKDGFRHFFNTSLYQFYTEARLKKAHLLIQQSGLPLKEIAFACGFSDYINFYKAFRKRFGYPPSQLTRREGDPIA
jgi:AraC-like DNA-binding protein